MGNTHTQSPPATEPQDGYGLPGVGFMFGDGAQYDRESSTVERLQRNQIKSMGEDIDMLERQASQLNRRAEQAEQRLEDARVKAHADGAGIALMRQRLGVPGSPPSAERETVCIVPLGGAVEIQVDLIGDAHVRSAAKHFIERDGLSAVLQGA